MAYYNIFFIVIASVSFTLRLISLKNAVKEKSKKKITISSAVGLTRHPA